MHLSYVRFHIRWKTHFYYRKHDFMILMQKRDFIVLQGRDNITVNFYFTVEHEKHGITVFVGKCSFLWKFLILWSWGKTSILLFGFTILARKHDFMILIETHNFGVDRIYNFWF